VGGTRLRVNPQRGGMHRRGGERRSDARSPGMRAPLPPPPPARLALIRGWQGDVRRQLGLPPAALTSPTGYEGARLGQRLLLQVFAGKGRGRRCPCAPSLSACRGGALAPHLQSGSRQRSAPQEKRFCQHGKQGRSWPQSPLPGTRRRDPRLPSASQRCDLRVRAQHGGTAPVLPTPLPRIQLRALFSQPQVSAAGASKQGTKRGGRREGRKQAPAGDPETHLLPSTPSPL